MGLHDLQRSRQTMDGRLRVVLAECDQVAVFLFDLDAGRQWRIQLALRPLHRDRIAFDFDRDPLGNRDRLFSNS